MGSFCGIWSRGGDSPRIPLENAVTCLNYWGAAHVEVKHTDSISFANLSAGKIPDIEPQTIETAEMVFCGNCRIDNRKELYSNLELENFSSDPEFVMSSYQKWGEEFLVRLHGDFAFAIWDKTRRVLLVCRDRLGIKPLYYYQNRNYFGFSSEIKALFHVPEFSYDENDCRMKELMTMGAVGTLTYSDETIFKGILKVTPGSYFKLCQLKQNKYMYWNPAFDNYDTKSSYTDFIDGIREKISISVKARMRGINVGCELSGGLDSSIIFGHAIHNSLDIKTFTNVANVKNVGFPDERLFAEKLCEHFNIRQSFFVDGSGFDVESAIDAFTHAVDGPQFGLGNVFKYPLLKKVEQAGCNILLSGFGGDELLSNSGNYAYFDLLSQDGLFCLYRELNRSLSIKGAIKRLNKIAWQYMFGDISILLKEQFFPKSFMISNSILKIPENLRSSQNLKYFRSAQSSYENSIRKGNNNYLSQVLTGERREYISAFTSSLAQISHKVNISFPLLDAQLIEFFVSIPPKYKIPFQTNRRLMRDAAHGIIPDEFRLRRDKAGSIFPGSYQKFLEYCDERFTKESLSENDRIGQLNNVRRRNDMLGIRRNAELFNLAYHSKSNF